MYFKNQGGTIHFGLSDSGRIDGILVNHDQRDGFRSGKGHVLFICYYFCLLNYSL